MKRISLISALLISSLLIFNSCCDKKECNHQEKTSAVTESKDSVSYSYFTGLKENSLTFPYEQVELGYSFDALEPAIDKMTMEIHYSKHHAAYTANFNKALEENKLTAISIIDLFGKMSTYPAAIRNNGGGYYNHLLFWQVLSPEGGGKAKGKIAEAINKKFSSYESFVEQFSEAAKTQFGSGWAWLIVKNDGSLSITSTPNQDNPLMDVVAERGIPILGLDVWEHAYYLKYQNKRPDYISNFWNVVNWEEVERRYEEALELIKK